MYTHTIHKKPSYVIPIVTNVGLMNVKSALMRMVSVMNGFRDAFAADKSSEVTTWAVFKLGCEGKLGNIIDDLMDHICSIMPKFMVNCFIQQEQTKSDNRQRLAGGDGHSVSDNNASCVWISSVISSPYLCVFKDKLQSATVNKYGSVSSLLYCNMREHYTQLS